MCTRFYVEAEPFAPLITKAQKLSLADSIMRQCSRPITMSGEMRPTDVAAILAPNKEGKAAVFQTIWGFSHEAVTVPIVNCRIENADKKELWKDSWYRRRCVVPCSWYFEWEHFTDRNGKKQTGAKYLIQEKESHITYLAGLYRIEERNGIQVPVFSIITRDAVGDLKQIHDRMPVILKKDDVVEWIKPDASPGLIAERATSEVFFDRVGR